MSKLFQGAAGWKIDKNELDRYITLVLIRKIFLASAALLLTLVFFAQDAHRASAQWSCGLLQDCGFDNFYGTAGAGSGAWKIFKLSGSAHIGLNTFDAWPKGPSLSFSGDAPFDASVYQQVAVTPGNGYHFKLAYAVVDVNGAGRPPDNQVNRILGIDSYGGTDPRSGNVKWSADYFGPAHVTDPIEFDEYARASTITVFIRVINPYSDKHLDVFVDSASLDVNTSMTPISVAAPTAANAPPTDTAAPVVRSTRVPTTVALARTNTTAPDSTATPTNVPSSTSTSTATIEPSATSAPSPTRVRRATPTPVVEESTSVSPLALAVVGGVGLIGFGGAAVLFALAFFYWRRANKI